MSDSHSIHSLVDLLTVAPVGAVLIGESPSHLDWLVMEEEPPTFYNTSSLCGNCGNYDDGKMYYSPFYHHVTIKGLDPATTYYYRPVVRPNKEDFKKYIRGSWNATTTSSTAMYNLEDEARQDEEDTNYRELLLQSNHRRLNWPPYDGSNRDCPAVDKIRSFRTAPVPGHPQLNLAIMGDIGQFPHSEETVASMLQSRDAIDAVILAGDVAYTGQNHLAWDTFFDFLDDYPIADRIPMQIVPGNHDIDKAVGETRIFLAYETRFRMPRVHPPQLFEIGTEAVNYDHPDYPLPYDWGNAYYAFTYGPARIIMINSYSSMEPDSMQYKWIVEELEGVDRSVTPWVLAVLHAPIYNTFSLHQHDPQIVAQKQHLEPLFVKHKVNMIFSGHIHAYQRTKTVAHDEPHAQGPMHITIGAGGRKCEAPFKNAEPEAWLDVRDATVYGYGMFRVWNKTVAEWDWVHTGHNDDRDYNQLWQSNNTLPPGPGRDRIFLQNQYFLNA